MKRRLLVCCGETSGDLYAAELVRLLRLEPGEIEAFGLGGDRLAEQGVELLAHVRDLAVVGLLEVIGHLRRIHRVFRRVLAEVDRRRPDLAVLIDYPDFNLRLARELNRRGVPVAYYVSPQLWAWRRGRLRAIRETVARMIVIFPFEEPLYREAGVPVSFVGHPLVDLARPVEDRAAFLRARGLQPERPVVALLPGSRPGEVRRHLPRIADAVGRLARRRPDVQFILAVAPALDAGPLIRALDRPGVCAVVGETHSVLSACTVALVASGTATVEAALLGAPMVVFYRLSWLTFLLGRPLVRVPHYAMVNLIAGRKLVPELMQGDFSPDRAAREVLAILEDPERRSGMLAGLDEVRRRLGAPGASQRAARIVRDMLEGCTP